jgi:hypothetical protein
VRLSEINFMELSFFFSMLEVKSRHILPSSFICGSKAVCCDRMSDLRGSKSGGRFTLLLEFLSACGFKDRTHKLLF